MVVAKGRGVVVSASDEEEMGVRWKRSAAGVQVEDEGGGQGGLRGRPTMELRLFSSGTAIYCSLAFFFHCYFSKSVYKQQEGVCISLSCSSVSSKTEEGKMSLIPHSELIHSAFQVD